MANVIIQSVILFLVVGLKYGCIKLVRMNPGIISGFEQSEDPGQRGRDKVWVNLLLRYMCIANIVTIIGCSVGIVSGLQVIFCLFLLLPDFVALLFVYGNRKTAEKD